MSGKRGCSEIEDGNTNQHDHDHEHEDEEITKPTSTKASPHKKNRLSPAEISGNCNSYKETSNQSTDEVSLEVACDQSRDNGYPSVQEANQTRTVAGTEPSTAPSSPNTNDDFRQEVYEELDSELLEQIQEDPQQEEEEEVSGHDLARSTVHDLFRVNDHDPLRVLKLRDLGHAKPYDARPLLDGLPQLNGCYGDDSSATFGDGSGVLVVHPYQSALRAVVNVVDTRPDGVAALATFATFTQGEVTCLLVAAIMKNGQRITLKSKHCTYVDRLHKLANAFKFPPLKPIGNEKNGRAADMASLVALTAFFNAKKVMTTLEGDDLDVNALWQEAFTTFALLSFKDRADASTP